MKEPVAPQYSFICYWAPKGMAVYMKEQILSLNSFMFCCASQGMAVGQKCKNAKAERKQCH